jgi:ParB family chromosome partitioning protein
MPTHDDFDDFFDDDDAGPTLDTRADGRLLRVPLTRIAPNLVNPRVDFGTREELVDFGKSLKRRQNQACPVVTKKAYLKLWPDHAGKIGKVDVVLVSGERRFRAATVVELAGLDCVINDDFAASRKAFMEAVVSENVDRQNFDAIEEAYAVRSLVREFGSNRAVAQHFERVDGWVTQRILLTHLAPPIQDLVRKKAMPLEVARTLGKQARDQAWSAQQQEAWWDQEQQRRLEAAGARKASRQAAKAPERTAPTPEPARAAPSSKPTVKQGKPESFTAVKLADVSHTGSEAVEAAPAAEETDTLDASVDGIAEEDSTGQPDQVPEPRSHAAAESAGDGPESRTPGKLPYDDGHFIARHLIRKMEASEFDKMLAVLNQHSQQREGVR